MDEYKGHIINCIFQAIEKKGINRSELARLSGIPQPRLSDCMNESKKTCFTLDQLIRIADVLECSLDELVGRAGPASGGVSDRGLCMSVTDMLANGRAKMGKVTVTEEMYIPVDNEGFPDTHHKTGKNQYPCIYFSDYSDLPRQHSFDVTEEGELPEIIREYEIDGNVRANNKRLNAFLKQLYNLCLARDVIGSDTFRKIAIEKMDECKISN